MNWLSILVLAIAIASPSAAQGVLTVTTDKEVYTHGEPIEVRVRIDNPTNETFYLEGTYSCQAYFHFDVLGPIPRACTADEFIRQYNPGSWREWIWVFDPTIYGLPSVNGEVTVVGTHPGTEMTDSTTIQVPEYVGGHLGVMVLNHVTESELAPVLDSLNVTVLESRERSEGRSETWHIQGTSLDAAIARYATDSRFGYVERSFSPLAWTTVATEQAPEAMPERPNASPSLSVYPNPCRAQCEVDYSGRPDGLIRVDVFDVQGRAVLALKDPATFDASGLPTGVYFVRVVTRDASISKPFTVIR